MRPPGASGALPTDLDRALAVRDVMEHAVKVQREITAPKRLQRSRARLVLGLVLCVPLLALSAYSWIAKPEIIWGPRPHAGVPRREANARVAMFLVAQRLEAHRASEGSYPASLAAIGDGATGLSYRRLTDSTYELRDSTVGRGLVLRSGERPDVFLGNSLRVISGHAP